MSKTILRVLSSIVFPVAIAGIVLWLLGYHPIEAYTELIKGAFIGRLNLGTTLERFSPIFFTALAFAITIKAGFFNLGAEGALYIGALSAAGVGQIQGLPAVVHIPLTLLSGMLFGALWQMIPGFLRAFYRVNEMCSTIMMNYIATLFSSYMVLNPWVETQIATGRSKTIELSAQFPRILKPSRLTTGIFLTIIVFVFIYWLVNKTKFGFKLRSVGLNGFFSEYVGIDVRRTVVLSTMVSGAIAGMAGSVETMGTYYSMYDMFSSGTGFDGMLAALIAGNNLKMVPLTSFMIAAFKAGALGMERNTGIPKSLVDMFIPILIILLSIHRLYDVSGVFTKFRNLILNINPSTEDKR